MKTRGPDNQGIFNDKNIFLGHTRLSISDLDPSGNQPYSHSETPSYVLVYNGEIYNVKRIREELTNKGLKIRTNCDTELLYLLLINFDIKKVLSLINGMFSFAFYDEKKKELIIARDHCGIKPLYYNYNNQEVSFSSSFASLELILSSGLKNFSSDFSKEGISNYLNIGYSSDRITFNESIQSLPPGKYAKYSFSTKELNIFSWFNPSDDLFSRSKELRSSFISDLDKILSDVIYEQSRAAVSTGIFLSGGLDSALISSYLSNNKSHIAYTIKCFSADDFIILIGMV